MTITYFCCAYWLWHIFPVVYQTLSGWVKASPSITTTTTFPALHVNPNVTEIDFKKWQDQRTGTLWDLCRSSREGARTAKSDASHQWKVWQNEFCGRRAREATVKIMPFMYSRRQAMYSFSGGWRHRSRISLSSPNPYNLNRLKGKRKTDFGSESIGINLRLL